MNGAKKRIAILICAAAAISGMKSEAAKVYQESGGLVIMEMENTDSPLNLWEAKTSLSGYTGSGYLKFDGNTFESGPATSPLEYTFKVDQAGLYYLHLHCAKEMHDGRTDVANDCYVRVEGDYNAGPGPYTSHGDNASLSLLQSDTKYFGGIVDSWKWEDGELSSGGNGNLDPGGSSNKRVAVYDFKAGETYTLVVSGRSRYFRINRLMFRHTSVSKTAAENLSNPESDPVAATRYVYDATTDFPSYTNGVVPYYIHGAENALAIAANIVEYRDKFATAERTFDGDAGTYDVTITALREFDGECTYRFLVNGSIVGSAQNGEVSQEYDYAPQKHVFRNIEIPAGATIAVESNTDTNGKIPEPGGTAWARGRWTEVALTASSSSIVNPPDGRIALVSDGNSPDPDDIGAIAVALGILKASGQNERLVHMSHSCDLDPFLSGGSQTIDATNELRRQGKLYDLTEEGIQFFGPFTNLIDHYNCRSNQTAAVADLTAAIDASSASDPLWIIEAGEPDVIGYALSNAVVSARQHVHIISHHPANDNSGDYWSWPEIQAFGITEHQIGDQNVGLKVDISSGLWDWAENNSDPGMAWIWDQLKYAEQDGVVTFQTGKFDCSDAGMMYWWLTGADNGGNSNSTPVEVKAMLLHEDVTPPPASDAITLVNLGSPATWTDGGNWSDGQPAQAGKDYVVPATGNLKSLDGTSTFPGDSLTIQAGGKFQFRAKHELGQVTTVTNLIATGGTSGSSVNLAAGTGNNTANRLAGNLTNGGFTRLTGYGNATGPRNLRVSSAISGDGTLHSTGTLAFPHTCFIDNAANTFDGVWESNIGTLVFENVGAVGTADISVLDNGKLQILGDWDQSAVLTVADTANTSVDLGSYDWKVTNLNVGGSTVADGTYTAAQLNSMGSSPVFTGTGTIEVRSPQTLHHWKFDEGSGTTAADSAGSNDGVIDGATWATGTGDRASYLSFDGANDRVDPSLFLPQWSDSNAESWAVWINDGGGNNNDIILGNRDDAASNYPNGSNRLFAKMTIASTSGRFVYNDGTPYASDFNAGTPGYTGNFPDGTWVHLAIVRDGTDFTFYVDGSLVNETPFSIGAADMPTAGMSFFMGGEATRNGSEHFKGGLDDVVLYDFALTAENVVDVMNGVYSFNTGPVESPVLDLSMTGSDMVFNWTGGGFKVQSRTNLTEGSWQDVLGGNIPPVTNSTAELEEFFRLIEQ